MSSPVRDLPWWYHVLTATLLSLVLLGLTILLTPLMVGPASASGRAEVLDQDVAAPNVMIRGSDASGSWACSGFLVGPRTLATAGHCIKPGASYALEVGAVGDDSERGFHSVRSCYGGEFRRAPDYQPLRGREGSMEHDYALLEVASCLNSTGAAVYTLFDDYYQLGQYDSGPLTSLGYPANMPPGTLWKSTGSETTIGPGYHFRVLLGITENWALGTTVTTSGGSSGGVLLDESGVAVGVVTGTVEFGPSVSRRIDDEALEQYRSWLRDLDPTSTNAS